MLSYMPSVLGQRWLGVRESIRPAKIERWGVDVVIWLERGAGCLHVVQVMPLYPETPSLLPRSNPDWFYLSSSGLTRLS